MIGNSITPSAMFQSAKIMPSFQRRDDCLSAEAIERKNKIDMIGNRLRENVKILNELKSELSKIPDSFKEKLRESEILVSNSAEAIVNKRYNTADERYNTADERPIKSGHLEDICLPAPKPCNDSGIIVTPISSKQMFKTASNIIVPNHVNERYTKINNSTYFASRQQDLNTSKPENTEDSKQNFLRKRSKLKYDPMEASKQDKLKNKNPNLTNSNIQINDSQQLIKEDTGKSVVLFQPSNRNKYKRGESNSQIIHKNQNMNAESNKRPNYNQNKDNFNCKSEAKEPTYSKSKNKYGGKPEVMKSCEKSITSLDKSIKNKSINRDNNESTSQVFMNSFNNPNSSLLQIHEFEKMNEHFLKFKKNRKNTKEIGIAHKSGANLPCHKVNRRVNSIKVKDFDDETSEITIGASIDVAHNKKKTVINLEMKSCENKDLNLKASTFSYKCTSGNINTFDVQNDVQKPIKQANQEDEVNYLLFEEDQMTELCIPPKATQCKKIAKYRRNRNVRVDKDKLEKSRNYMVTSLSNNH